MGFFNVVPRDNEYLDSNIESIPLRVNQGKGMSVTPDLNISVSDLNKDKNNSLLKHFYNRGYGGITLKVEVLIFKDDTVGIKGSDGTVKVLDVLKHCIENMIPFMVTTKAIDVPNGLYIVTSNSSRTQTYEKSTVWELEFKTYNPVTVYQYVNNNTKVQNAIAKSKAAQAKKTTAKKTAKKTTKTASTKSSKLAKCSLKSLKYSKKKKVYDCVKLMQNVLKKKGFYTGKVDGWFGSMTTTAVKKFQKKYKKTYKLKTTGKVDKATLQALCKV